MNILTLSDYSVYKMIDPRDNEVFYIGESKQPYTRYGEHVALTEKNIEKQERILDIMSQGLMPLIVILETGIPMVMRHKREDYWISYYHSRGARLTNIKQYANKDVFSISHFDSILDAKWAMLFRKLDIQYEYQKERFTINEVSFLPSFWLPEQECWLEVEDDTVQSDERLYESFLQDIGPLVVFTDIDTCGKKYVLCSHESNGGLTSGDVEWYFCKKWGFQLSLRCLPDCTVFKHFYKDYVHACSACDITNASTHDFRYLSLIHAFNFIKKSL